jgi:hypothetical protein
MLSGASSRPPVFSVSMSIDLNIDSVNAGAIVGGVPFGVLVLVAACACWSFLKRRRRREQARLAPTPMTTQDPSFYHSYAPVGQVPYGHPRAGRAAVSSQQGLPIYHNVHSRSTSSSEVTPNSSFVTHSASQGPSMSMSGSRPPTQPRPGGSHSSSARNHIASPSVDELPQQGLGSRRYSPQSMPPPYSPNGGRW